LQFQGNEETVGFGSDKTRMTNK